ncbi:uncharacterized protein B0H64DRAFT_200523 [Chaetomium fimeti]|uniref:Uncharacterized protein n=1 Tax=Chaetomium fimeti TaxID=1854472 RepID=A0AAE0LRQ7_9PEZI|nr:hypothetical protein B0H64DRAFT_200523 [Chaetomium fimeti]
MRKQIRQLRVLLLSALRGGQFSLSPNTSIHDKITQSPASLFTEKRAGTNHLRVLRNSTVPTHTRPTARLQPPPQTSIKGLSRKTKSCMTELCDFLTRHSFPASICRLATIPLPPCHPRRHRQASRNWIRCTATPSRPPCSGSLTLRWPARRSVRSLTACLSAALHMANEAAGCVGSTPSCAMSLFVRAWRRLL